MPGFCPGYITGESRAESHQRCLHVASAIAKKYGAGAERRAHQAGSASSTSISGHRQADNRWCSDRGACVCKSARQKRKGEKSAPRTRCIWVPAPPIFQAWSRVITSLTGCENRIQKEQSLTLASGYFSAGGGEASAVWPPGCLTVTWSLCE